MRKHRIIQPKIIEVPKALNKEARILKEDEEMIMNVLSTIEN